MMKLHTKLLGAVALSACVTTTQAETTFTPDQQDEIGRIAADYLVKHPEVLIQVSQELKKKQQEQQQAQREQINDNAVKLHARLMDLKGIPHVGPDDAKVTVTEFFDYQCYYCNKMAPEVEKLIANNPNVKFIFRDWPIFAARWKTSLTSAYTGLEVWKQKGADAYLAYHNGIYATGHNEGKLTAKDIKEVADKALNAPLKKYSADETTVEHNNQLATDLGFSGTPGFIITPAKGATADNTIAIDGAVDLSVLQNAIDKAAK